MAKELTKKEQDELKEAAKKAAEARAEAGVGQTQQAPAEGKPKAVTWTGEVTVHAGGCVWQPGRKRKVFKREVELLKMEPDHIVEKFKGL